MKARASDVYDGKIIFLDSEIQIGLKGLRSNYVNSLRELGYEISAVLTIKPQHLPYGSHVVVRVRCPRCNEARSVRYQSVARKNNTLCHSCACEPIN